MARPLRIDVPDGLYHVTSRGIDRRPIVGDDRDRARWRERLDAVARRRRWRVFAYVLLDNHYHLFVQTPGADLSAGMHDLNGGHAVWFNRRHERVGPLFQGRFHAVLVESAAHDWELSRYVHLNPVRAGLAKRPEAYRWSSCRFYFQSRGAPRWLAWEDVLGRHGRTLRTARRAYAAYLEEGLAARIESPLSKAVASTLLGSESFVERMRAWLQDRLPDRDVPAALSLRPTVQPEAIEAAVCNVFAASPEQLHARRRHGNVARGVAAYLCRKWTREPLTTLGQRFGGVTGAAICITVAQLRSRIGHDRTLATNVRRCEKRLGENLILKT